MFLLIVFDARRKISTISSSIVHSSGGLISKMGTCRGTTIPIPSQDCNIRVPCPVSIQSGLIPFFRSAVRSQSGGIVFLFFASEIDDCFIPKNFAKLACILPPQKSVVGLET